MSNFRTAITILGLLLGGKNAYALETSTDSSKHSLTITANTPKAGDCHARNKVRFIPSGQEGENILWDFSEAEDVQKDSVQYICNRDSLLLCIETDKKHIFVIHDDSLLLYDTESALYSIHYDKPLLLASYPFAYNDTIQSSFHGTGTYCKTCPIEVNGTFMTVVDGYGTLCLQEGDTLHNVLRLHSIRTAAFHIPDNGNSLLPLPTHAKQEIEERYYWFARGYRYPLYETATNTWYHDQQQISSTSMSFRSDIDNLRQLDDSVNHAIQWQDSILASQQEEKPDIMKYTLNVNGAHAILRYSLTEPVTLHALLCDASGFVFQRKSASGEPGTEYEMDIDCTGLRRDVYILYLNANGQVYSETISTK